MQIDRNSSPEPQVGFVPSRVYTCLVKEVNNAPAATGTAQSRIKFEIVAPAEVTEAGDVFKTAGQGFDTRVFFTEKTTRRALDELTALGLKSPALADDTSEVQEEIASLVNHYVDVYVSNQPRYKRVGLTPAEIAKGKKPYEAAIFKDANGQPIMDGYEFNVRLTDLRPGTIKTPIGDPF